MPDPNNPLAKLFGRILGGGTEQIPNAGGQGPSYPPDMASKVNWEGFSTRFADMANSPYMAFQPNSLMGRHPGIAGALDNALLTAAMIEPPQAPSGVGAGIHAAAQGLVGAPVARMQRQMQMAMMPMQLQMAQAGLQKTQAEAFELGQRGKYFGERAGAQVEAMTERGRTAALLRSQGMVVGTDPKTGEQKAGYHNLDANGNIVFEPQMEIEEAHRLGLLGKVAPSEGRGAFGLGPYIELSMGAKVAALRDNPNLKGAALDAEVRRRMADVDKFVGRYTDLTKVEPNVDIFRRKGEIPPSISKTLDRMDADAKEMLAQLPKPGSKGYKDLVSAEADRLAGTADYKNNPLGAFSTAQTNIQNKHQAMFDHRNDWLTSNQRAAMSGDELENFGEYLKRVMPGTPQVRPPRSGGPKVLDDATAQRYFDAAGGNAAASDAARAQAATKARAAAKRDGYQIP